MPLKCGNEGQTTVSVWRSGTRPAVRAGGMGTAGKRGRDLLSMN